MRKQILFLLFGITSLYGCINSNSLKPVIPSHLINANSAKTWVEVAHIKQGADYAPLYNESKRTYTFFDNGTFREQQLIHLGSQNGRIGKYNVTISANKDTTFNINYDNGEHLSFNIDFLDTRVLELSNDSLMCSLETLTPPKVE